MAAPENPSATLTIGTTPGHVVWTFERGWTYAANLQVGDHLQGLGGEALAITEILLDPTPTTVYNFEVAGAWTYFVEGVWVHNSSGNLCRRIAGAFDLFNVERLPNSALARKPKARGLAPIGVDGNSVHIHHANQNPEGPFIEILRKDHQALRHPNPGLTAEQRSLFNSARTRYWERMWDEGRFNNLPE